MERAAILRPIACAIAVLVVAAAVARRPDVRAAVRIPATALALVDDVWSDAGDPVAVAPVDRLRAAGVPYTVIVDDIDAVAAAERRRLARRAQVTDWFAEYRDVDEIDAYLDGLAARHPDIARIHVLGASIEGRPIRALELSRGGSIAIAIDGGHHAREWISMMVPVCIADRLATATDPRTRAILEAVRFFVVPVVNPDGYAYTWTVDRYWRKNRRGGHGVDLSRNYSVGWGGAGSSGDRASPNYRGERAFSEPETRALRALFERQPIAAHVDFHSFSQVIVYPWSHRRGEPPDEAAFAAIAERMAAAIHATHGERYAIRPGSALSVGAGGTAGDWSYGEHGALSFLVELRPARGGFVLPPEQIAPTCDESLAGVLALAEWVIGHRA